ncbi:hypothetical protein L3X38_009865 [Prunus dulcis]|uniref:Uncharacterized protein n=1 Tax=Prunus dulcis TaxID=3755 RepID=A0AAD4WEC3_PRUDU|nr:hypothetical protein L3X38_009865 [Prunus dulcis]
MCLIWHTRIHLARGLLGAHWLRSCKNSEVKRVGGWSNPRMGDHPGKLLVSSQKQNRAGSEGGPKRTISCYGGADPGVSRGVGYPALRQAPYVALVVSAYGEVSRGVGYPALRQTPYVALVVPAYGEICDSMAWSHVA